MNQLQNKDKLPQINTQVARYVQLLRNSKGKFVFPNNQSSIYSSSRQLHKSQIPEIRYSQFNQEMQQDEQITKNFENLIGQVKQKQPKVSIYRSVLKSNRYSESLAKKVEKENSYPLPNMIIKKDNISKEYKLSTKKKIDKTVQLDNPCRPLMKNHIKRNPSQAILENCNKFCMDDLRLNKTPEAVEDMKKILSYYISNNRKFFNKEVIKIPEYEKSAPFYVDSLKYADLFLKGTKQVPKNLGFPEENLFRNNLVLEKVMLERLIEKQDEHNKNNQIKSFMDEQIRISSRNNTQNDEDQAYEDEIKI